MPAVHFDELQGDRIWRLDSDITLDLRKIRSEEDLLRAWQMAVRQPLLKFINARMVERISQDPPQVRQRVMRSMYLGHLVEFLKIDEMKRTDPVLDLGTGQGGCALMLIEQGFQNVVGVDISEEMLGLAERTARNGWQRTINRP